jgi:hypothetical protein
MFELEYKALLKRGWESFQLLCPGQTRTRVAWELNITACIAKTLINYIALIIKIWTKVDESQWDLSIKRKRELQLLWTLILVWPGEGVNSCEYFPGRSSSLSNNKKTIRFTGWHHSQKSL